MVGSLWLARARPVDAFCHLLRGRPQEAPPTASVAVPGNLDHAGHFPSHHPRLVSSQKTAFQDWPSALQKLVSLDPFPATLGIVPVAFRAVIRQIAMFPAATACGSFSMRGRFFALAQCCL